MGDERHRISRRPPHQGRRRTIRRVCAGMAFAVAVLYLVLLVVVADAEAGSPENSFGAYLFLSASYLLGWVPLARSDSRLVYVFGAVVQLGVITLFVLFRIGVFGPGVFEYEALDRLAMPVWAGILTGAEVALLGLLTYLAVTAERTSIGRPPRAGGEVFHRIQALQARKDGPTLACSAVAA